MPKEVPTVPGTGKVASQARATHRLGVPRAGPLWEQVVPTSSQSLWGVAGGPQKGGPGLAGGQGTLPGQLLYLHPLLHALNPCPSHPFQQAAPQQPAAVFPIQNR